VADHRRAAVRIAQNHLRRLNFVDGPAREPRSFRRRRHLP
jgi:hypothetical protein